MSGVWDPPLPLQPEAVNSDRKATNADVGLVDEKRKLNTIFTTVIILDKRDQHYKGDRYHFSSEAFRYFLGSSGG